MIDISEIAKGKEDEYLRHLSDLCSCPCTTCTAICLQTCLKYQLWLDMKWKERELLWLGEQEGLRLWDGDCNRTDQQSIKEVRGARGVE